MDLKEVTHERWLKGRLARLFGRRCKDYEPGCACCQAWFVYDAIRDARLGKI